MSGQDVRIRTALHEAGHAVVAWRLGRALREVSIDPRDDHLGHVLHDSAFATGSPPTDIDIPIHGSYRDVLETDMLIALAGAFAEDLAGTFLTGYTVRPDELWAEQAAERMALVSPRAKELTDEERIHGHLRAGPDEADALDRAKVLAGDEAVQHLAWMRAVARRLVADTAYLIEPLASVLLEETRVLSGQHATAIIAAHLKGSSHAHIA